LSDTTLSTERLCEVFGISRTRLYKMFASSDGVASYIRNRRLSAALATLRDPQQGHRKIIDLALTFGFGSEASFIRAFRRRYGMTPGDARHNAAEHSTLPSVSLYDFGGTEWRDWMQLA